MEEIFTTTRGIRLAQSKNGQNMKRNREFRQIIKPRTRLSLGDLILAVSSCTRSRDRKSTRLNSSHSGESRMPSSA